MRLVGDRWNYCMCNGSFQNTFCCCRVGFRSCIPINLISFHTHLSTLFFFLLLLSHKNLFVLCLCGFSCILSSHDHDTHSPTAGIVCDRNFKENILDYVVPNFLPEGQEYFFLCNVYIEKKHPVMIVSQFLGFVLSYARAVVCVF